MTRNRRMAGTPDAARERVGALVIRVWQEPSPDGLRVRIISTTDVAETGGEQVDSAHTPDQVCAIVRRWLDEYIG